MFKLNKVFYNEFAIFNLKTKKFKGNDLALNKLMYVSLNVPRIKNIQT